MSLVSPAVPEITPECTVVEWVRQSARRWPDREAVVLGSTRVSWRDFDQRVNRVANALLKLGLQRNDRIAVLASNSIEYLEVFMGALRACTCVVPLSTMASATALQKMVIDSSAKVVFLDDAMRQSLGTDFCSSPSVIPNGRIALNFELDDWVGYESVLAASDSVDPIENDSACVPALDDFFNIIYSSGTTGVPKGILHNHQMRAVQMERVEQNGYANQSRTLLSTPLYSNTTIVALLPTLVGGGTVVLMSKFDAREYLDIAQRERCTHTMLVPVQYKRIMALEDFDQFDLSSMQYKFSTSAPFQPQVKRDVLQRFPGELTEYYGLTEGGGVTVLAAHEHPDQLHTVGQPAPGVILKFIDENGVEVKKGDMGEICGRSPAMMSGYFGRDDITRETLWHDSDGNVFFRSGDMGHIDSDGFVHLTDRKKDMIISGGLNIYANDLELVLLADPDVDDAAVIGIPSEQWGETPLGLVVLRSGATRNAEDIKVTANQELGKSQKLAKVETRERLSRSTIGKILKRELREPYWI